MVVGGRAAAPPPSGRVRRRPAVHLRDRRPQTDDRARRRGRPGVRHGRGVGRERHARGPARVPARPAVLDPPCGPGRGRRLRAGRPGPVHPPAARGDPARAPAHGHRARPARRGARGRRPRPRAPAGRLRLQRDRRALRRRPRARPRSDHAGRAVRRRPAVEGYGPYERLREAALAAGAQPAGDGHPGVEDALRRFGAMATPEIAAVCDLPGPRAPAELWRLALEWRVRPRRVAGGELWELA